MEGKGQIEERSAEADVRERMRVDTGMKADKGGTGALLL